MILNYLLLPVFFFIGLVTSYEDFRFGKIRNKWIAIGAVWGFTVSFSFFIFSAHFSFLADFLLNSFLALSVAYLIWRFSGWAAGDAKLFFVFSLLIPISYYQRSYLSFFPSFALLINIFIPLLLFLFFRACFVLFFKFRNLGFEISKRFFLDKNYWIMSASFFAGFLGIFLLSGFLKEKIDGSFLRGDMVFLQTLFIVALIILRSSFSAFFRKKIVIKAFFLIFALSAFYGVVFAPHLTWQIFSRTAPWLLVFMFILGLFGKLLNFYVSGSEKRGMGAFSMAIWIFSGGLITLILKGSVLSLILGYIF